MSHSTKVILTDAQYARLQKESQRSGLTVSELVRRAVDQCYGQRPDDATAKGVEGSFGAWKDRDYSGEDYVERLRRGFRTRPGR